jgi:hypothetical protein
LGSAHKVTTHSTGGFLRTYKISQKKDFGTESRHIRVENRKHTGGCRGFSRRIHAEFGTKDFFEMDCKIFK